MEDKKEPIPFKGCFSVILLSALCGIAINECGRSEMRFERDKILHERFLDSINSLKADTTTYIFNQQKQQGK
jgi:hypothetical protein